MTDENGEPGITVPNYGREAILESEANKRQHGGDHYKRLPYEHWDFVMDTGMNYLLGCATKYVARWRTKNGEEDLLKAVHYMEKALELGYRATAPSGPFVEECVNRFCDQLEYPNDAAIIRMIMGDGYHQAIAAMRFLITDES